MSPEAVSTTIKFTDFFAIAPEVVLAAWGLVLLAADLGLYRGQPGIERQKKLGRLAIVGALLALAAALATLLVRYNSYGMQSSRFFNPGGMDYGATQDPALFLGTISGDLLTDLFNILFAGLLVLIVWLSMVWSFTEDWGEYFALLFWSTVGMMLLTASEEFLTLFLTLEMMTICLYLLTAFEKDKKRSAEGGLKYFVYGSVSSALFLFGLSLLYGLTGTTQFNAINFALQPEFGGAVGLSKNLAGATAVLLMLVGFGFKVAAVPFHQWAPDAYEGAPAPITAWIAAGSKLASFIALMKVLLTAIRPWESGEGVSTPGWIGLVAVLAAASMTYGNFAALAQRNYKRMLAYSSIAQAGYMLVGVAAAGVSKQAGPAVTAVLYYLVTYAFVTVGAFAVAAWLARDKGSDEIEDLNGMGSEHPTLAVCLTLLMLSLIGMPPLAGFFGKLYMFMEALDESNPGHLTLMWLVALGLLNSVVSAFYYVRVLKAMFLRPSSGRPLGPPPSPVIVSVLLSTLVAVGLGLDSSHLLETLRPAALQMLSTSPQMGLADRTMSISPPTGPDATRTPPRPLSPAADAVKQAAGAARAPAEPKATAPATTKGTTGAAKTN